MAGDESGWEAGTWDGARRAQLQRALKLTVRQRLEALAALSETSRRLSEIATASTRVERPDANGPAQR